MAARPTLAQPLVECRPDAVSDETGAYVCAAPQKSCRRGLTPGQKFTLAKPVGTWVQLRKRGGLTSIVEPEEPDLPGPAWVPTTAPRS